MRWFPDKALFPGVGRSSTKPRHQKAPAAAAPFVRLAGRCLAEGCSAASRSSPLQPPEEGCVAVRYPGPGAGPALGVAVSGVQGWHSTVGGGVEGGHGTARHGDSWYQHAGWYGTAWNRAAGRAALLTPLPPNPAQGHWWSPPGLSSSSQKRAHPPLGASSFPHIHPPRTRPSQSHVTPTLTAQRCAQHLCGHPPPLKQCASSSPSPPRPQDPAPLPTPHAPASPHAYKPPPQSPMLLGPFAHPQQWHSPSSPSTHAPSPAP